MAGSMNSGRCRNRLPSAETCRARGWDVGTVIQSSGWRDAMRITKIKGVFVTCRNVVSGGQSQLRSFPPDTQSEVTCSQ